MSVFGDSPYLQAMDIKGPVPVYVRDHHYTNFYYRRSMPLREAYNVFEQLESSAANSSILYIKQCMLNADGSPHEYTKTAINDPVYGSAEVIGAIIKALREVDAGGMHQFITDMDKIEIRNKRTPPKGVKQQAPQEIITPMMPKGIDVNIAAVMLLAQKGYYEVLQMQLAEFRFYYELDRQVKNNPSLMPGGVSL